MIGISKEVETMTSASVVLESGGDDRAGEITKYEFTFKTTTELEAGDYMRFTFPAAAGFTLNPYPFCEAFSISDYAIPGQLFCYRQGSN